MGKWESPDPAAVKVVETATQWDEVAADYGANGNTLPLRRCLDTARAGGATTVVTETRYIDVDYRSEYSAFYSLTFANVADSAQRLHFFRAKLRPTQLWKLPKNHGYLGYVVLRDSELGRVGRAMLQPPPGLLDAVRTSVTDQVSFFGQTLTVTGVPFVQQDTQLGRCAHAAAWMCHHSAYLRREVARRAMAQFSLSADPSLGWGRPLPSEGLTVQQILELLRVFGLPARFYGVDCLPPAPVIPWPQPPALPLPKGWKKKHPGVWDTRMIATCCRYLNSGYPVLVVNQDHAFVLCGYRREKRVGKRDWITFVRHDDQRGPYLPVSDIFKDIDGGYVYSPWEGFIVPLPEKLWLPPEPAEQVGAEILYNFAKAVSPKIAGAKRLLDRMARGRIALRTYASSSNRFKGELDRGIDPNLIREYRLARFSRFLWIVEAVDRDLRNSGKSCVLGEAIFDATSSENDPNALAVHVPGVAWVHRFEGPPRFPIRCGSGPYDSGGFGSP